MACTTILVGKNASYDGSTMIARNDDSGSGHFTAKKFTVTNFEYTNGANTGGGYQPQPTSYDYDAPLGECLCEQSEP